ncbi:serine/threonine protein kinase [Streptomyces sp. Je 1-79]|uniref:serine/threonine-protein kinase n=1 Tax=Streptomyces sp. Je 1-79 TaxID=2943847 RepID=UPI0021A87D2A|nr:serine/threonine-protein kinase [Streptomyces sp. Je 1-79]MCT4354878.1 serine/threonine protein kinase [Streptomyces sp. Je 1-79]
MGEVFAGRYELIDPIGRGGVGAVWRAWDHRRRRYVAAKVLQQSDAHTLLRFVREQALRIDHPHVLAPASWAADDDKVLFTMDLVAGGSLAHVIGDYGPLPPRFVCTLLDQLLSGLATVHAEGVVHRDIKPANILLDVTGTGRPHLRLSDFGISMRKGEPRLTETNYVVGTPGYFAPEQMLGAEPDFPADLFAVGLVALYLLQGQKPDSRALIEHFMAHGTPGAPEGIPEPLWQVLAGLLQPDPQARFKTATGVRKALTAAVEMLPEPRPDEEPVEVFDQIGPLPAGFGPNGPETPAPHPPTAPVHVPPSVHPQDQPQTPAQQAQQQLPSASETGSFHLPPPPRQPAAAPTQPPVPVSSAHAASPHPAAAPDYAQAPTAAVSFPQPSTRQYTAHAGQVPVRATPGASAPAKRPGPPPKVAIPVLFVALVCFAVGIWALTQT